MSIRLGEKNFREEVLESDKLVLADFYSDSCVPCKRLSPILAELEEKYGEAIRIGKVNVAYEENLIQEYGITTAPTILIFQKGVVMDKLTGKMEKSYLSGVIEKYLHHES